MGRHPERPTRAAQLVEPEISVWLLGAFCHAESTAYHNSSNGDLSRTKESSDMMQGLRAAGMETESSADLLVDVGPRQVSGLVSAGLQ